MDAVAALDKMFDRVNDGKPRPNIGLKTVLGVLGLRQPLQILIAFLRIRGCNFVGRHHPDGGLQRIFIDACNRFTGGVVHEQGILQIHVLHC